MAKKKNQAHAKLSASKSSQWLNCPGSINAEEQVKSKAKYKELISVYADEGTMAHELADMCMKSRVDADTYIGKTISKVLKNDDGTKRTIKHKVDKEMADNVQQYLDYVYAFETKNSVLFTEERLDFSNIVPEGFGTMDSGLYLPKVKTVHIFDLKYGKGVMVDAFENTQGQMYSIGFLNEFAFMYDIEKFVIHICQPRKDNFSSWEISVDDLNIFSKWVAERAELVLTKDAPRVPGEKQCQWCVAKNDCKALATFTANIIGCDFDEIDKDELNSQVLTDAEKKLIIDNKKLIIDYVLGIYKDVSKSMFDGNEFNGYKIVEGRSTRAWGDKAEKYLAKTLGDEAYNKKLIGITEAQKHIGREKVDELAFKPKGKLTIAPEWDKRRAVSVREIDLFDTTDDESEDDE